MIYCKIVVFLLVPHHLNCFCVFATLRRMMLESLGCNLLSVWVIEHTLSLDSTFFRDRTCYHALLDSIFSLYSNVVFLKADIGDYNCSIGLLILIIEWRLSSLSSSSCPIQSFITVSRISFSTSCFVTSGRLLNWKLIVILKAKLTSIEDENRQIDKTRFGIWWRHHRLWHSVDQPVN